MSQQQGHPPRWVEFLVSRWHTKRGFSRSTACLTYPSIQGSQRNWMLAGGNRGKESEQMEKSSVFCNCSTRGHTVEQSHG